MSDDNDPMAWDQNPRMVSARLGIRHPEEALGHDDVRHETRHQRLITPPAHLGPCARKHRCLCVAPTVPNRCCQAITQEDGLCDACRAYCLGGLSPEDE